MDEIFKNLFSDAQGVAVARGPDQKTPASPGCKPQWCCHCKVVVLGNGVQKSMKDLPAHMKVTNRKVLSTLQGQYCGILSW